MLDSKRIADRLKDGGATKIKVKIGPEVDSGADEESTDEEEAPELEAGKRAFAAYKHGDVEAFVQAIKDICG